LGGQQQTIAQNQQLFPLTNLSTASGLLRGYSVPTGTRTTAEMSPLSAAATIGAGAAGLVQPKYDTAGNLIKGSSLMDQITNVFKPTTTPPVDITQGNPLGNSNIDKSQWVDNGDGTFTTATGQIVDANGNPQD